MTVSLLDYETILLAFYLIGITVEASSGALAAGRKKMDVFGVLLIANIAAFGGGTVRDILLGHYPLTWISHPNYIIFTLASAVITMIVANHLDKLFRLFLVLDALGLSAFAVIGYYHARELALPYFIAMIMGVLTGVFGGLLRDIFCHQEPLVLRKEVYAVAALAGTTLLAVFEYFALPHAVSVILGLLLIFIIRIAAIFWSLELPKFSA